MSQTCNKCKPADNVLISYVVHESDMARSERTNRRLWVVVIILIATLIISNLAWIVYEYQYQQTEIERYNIEQEASGNSINNSIIGRGDINGKAAN